MLLALLAWGWNVSRHLGALRRDLNGLVTVSFANPSDIATTLQALQHDTSCLHRDLALPLALAPYLGWLPHIGPTVEAAPELVSICETLLETGTTCWNLLEEPLSNVLQNSGATSDVMLAVADQITAHEAELRTATASAQAALDRLAALDTSRLVARVADPLVKVQAWVPLARAGLDGVLLVPQVLADPGEQTYLLLAQNSDELRATGGFISSIGTLILRNGLPHLGAFADSYQAENWDAPHPDPPDALREYMDVDLWTTRDTNWWPDFPTSARAALELYKLNQGVEADGVLAVDMLAAAQLIEALTPLKLSDGTVLQSGEVLEAYRASWSMPEDALVAPATVITATRSFSSAEVSMVLNDRQGTAWFDDVAVVRQDAPDRNLVTNASFEEDADGDGLPDGWTARGLDELDGLDADYAQDGQRSLRLAGALEIGKGLSQDLAIAGQAGDVLLISAACAADNVDLQGGQFALKLTLHYDDGSSETFSASFPGFSHSWASAGTAKALGKWFTHRKDFISRIGAAAWSKVTTSPTSVRWADVLTALSDALAERHIQLYACDADWQALWTRYGWDGGLTETTSDYVLVVDSNIGYNKVSANIEQSMAYSVTLGVDNAMATLTLHYRNTSSQAVRACDKFRQYATSYLALTQGCYWDYVRVYVPMGAQLLAASGGDEPARLLTENGKTVFATSLVLSPGEERTLHFEYTLPSSVVQGDEYRLIWQKQAGTLRLPVTVTVAADGLEAIGDDPVAEQQADGCLSYRADLRTDLTIAARWVP